jgi:hypothetical protein
VSTKTNRYSTTPARSTKEIQCSFTDSEYRFKPEAPVPLHNLPDHLDRRTVDQNIAGLAALVQSRVRAGWSPYLLTLSFAPLPPNPMAGATAQMGDAVDRLYRTFLTSVVRSPTSPSAVDSLPILIAAPDLPVPKRSRPAGDPIALNGGLHFHGVLVVPPSSRLRTAVDRHFVDQAARYLRWPVTEIDVRQVGRTPERVVDYVLKSVRRRRFSLDDVLILPRARSEVRRAGVVSSARSGVVATARSVS